MGFYRPPIFYALALAQRRRVYRCSSRHRRLGDFLSMMEEARGITANRIRFDHSTIRSRFDRTDQDPPATRLATQSFALAICLRQFHARVFGERPTSLNGDFVVGD